MTNNEIKFRAELLELLKRHRAHLTKDRVYHPGDSENPTFVVPCDDPNGYSTGITISDIAEELGGWVK